MNTARFGLFCISIAALLSSGCSTPGPSGGSTTQTPTPARSSATAVAGTVQSVDPQARTFTVGAGAKNQTSLRTDDWTVLTYDSSTIVEYQGQKAYNPQDLEVGDRIEAQVERSGNQVLARNVKVISSVSGTSTPSGAVAAPWAATVRSMNPGDRSIELVQSSREQFPITVYYDAKTITNIQGRTSRPEDLQRDDAVQVRTHSVGSQLIADEIVVTRNSGAAQGAVGQQQLRGTIRNIDTTARSIEIDPAAMGAAQGQGQGFDATKPAGYTTVAYDASTIVEYQGQRYGVANLERGDVVNIDVNQVANGYLAKRITVAQAR